MVNLFCDADFAGDPESLKSTNGHHGDVQGPNSRFPWAAASKGQTPRSESTPEAEINSAGMGIKTIAIPAVEIFEVLLKPYHPEEDWKLRVDLHEDNSTTVQVAYTGKNPSMKLLERGHGISVGNIHEHVRNGDINFIHTRSEHMSADIYTKHFTNPQLWNRLRMLINIYTPQEIATFTLNPDNSYLPVKESVIHLSGGKVIKPLGGASEETRGLMTDGDQGQSGADRALDGGNSPHHL